VVLLVVTLLVVRMMFGFLESSFSRHARELLKIAEPLVMFGMVFAVLKATAEHAREMSYRSLRAALDVLRKDTVLQSAIVVRAILLAVCINGVASLVGFLFPGSEGVGSGLALPRALREIVAVTFGSWLGFRLIRAAPFFGGEGREVDSSPPGMPSRSSRQSE